MRFLRVNLILKALPIVFICTRTTTHRHRISAFGSGLFLFAVISADFIVFFVFLAWPRRPPDDQNK